MTYNEHRHSKHPKTNFVADNVVYIHGEFDETITTEVIHQFRELIANQAMVKESIIIIDINSPGGLVSYLSELIALVEEAKALGITIQTRAMSEAHSCGAMLLMSGSPGMRLVSPFTQVLVHHATSGFIHSTDKQLERNVARAKHTNDMIEKLLKRYTKIPKKTMTEMLSDDSYYVTGKELIDLGIADLLLYDL